MINWRGSYFFAGTLFCCTTIKKNLKLQWNWGGNWDRGFGGNSIWGLARRLENWPIWQSLLLMKDHGTLIIPKITEARVLRMKKDELKINSSLTLDFSWRFPGLEMNYSNLDPEFLKGSVHNHYSFSQAMKLQAGSTGPCSGSGSCSDSGSSP